MNRQSFNEGWIVSTTGNMVGELLGEKQAPPKSVTLPHDAMIALPRKEKNPAQNSGGFFPGGDYTYTKTFFVPEGKKERYCLEFEGIYETGMVYVNGNFTGSVDYGYTRLIVDVTDFLIWGQDNFIVVKTYNSAQPNTRWYTGSGIYRPVWLYTGGSVRIPVDGVRIQTPDASNEISRVVVETILDNDEGQSRKVTLKTRIQNRAGECVSQEKTTVSLYGHEKKTVRQVLYIRNATLWSVEEPSLYQCGSEVRSDGGVLDSADTTFGIRRLELDPMHGLRVNGSTVLLRGACIHQDHGILGTASFKKAERRKVRLLKEAGFNAIRISHHSATKALLEACDELGMLVLDEVFDVWNHCKTQYDYSLRFAKNWERDIEDLVRKDFNHPSVFMYSYGNEIQELATISGAWWCRAMAEKIRELDATRFVTNSINGLAALEEHNGQIAADMGILPQEVVDRVMEGTYDGDINELMTVLHGAMNQMATHPMIDEAMCEAYSCLDACGLNYMRDCYELYAKQHPNRITFGSETLPPDIALNWEKVKAIPSCIGDFTWTGWDYIGESGIGIVQYGEEDTFFKPYPAYLAYVGDLDITGFRRPISYYREIVFGLRKKPYLAVQNPENFGRKENKTPWTCSDLIAGWTWPGQEGKPCKVEIYSPSEEVELRLNGRSLGRYPTGAKNRYKAELEVCYEAGILEAVAYDSGEEGETVCLCTAGEQSRLKVECDTEVLQAGEQDLAYLAISVVDENGVTRAEREASVAVKVNGAAVLFGLGSANPVSEENFYDMTRTTFHGMAQAVIRSAKESGQVEVLVEAEGCESVVLKLETVSEGQDEKRKMKIGEMRKEEMQKGALQEVREELGKQEREEKGGQINE